MSGSGGRVSVIMPVYNGGRFLREAVDSVLGQTFDDFELVAVDDGSTDDSVAILTEYAERDPRVRVSRHPENRGHHHTSNDAIGLAQGELVARMDQDDLWLPRRLEASVAHLDEHPEVGLLATAYVRLLPDGTRLERHPPRSHTRIRTRMVFGNIICHPSVTVRRSLIATGELRYRDLPGPQDYDLWVRLLEHTEAHILDEPLVVYRQHSATMSELFRDDLPLAAEDISNRQLRGLLGPDLDDDTLRSIRRLAAHRAPKGRADYERAGLVLDVFDALAKRPDISPGELASVRRTWCRRALTAAVGRGPNAAAPLVREIGRRDPAALASWVGRDLPSRTLSAARHRAAGRPRPALT
jgi:glycosyltransferase involved in cell wall biosynthesis